MQSLKQKNNIMDYTFSYDYLEFHVEYEITKEYEKPSFEDWYSHNPHGEDAEYYISGIYFFDDIDPLEEDSLLLQLRNDQGVTLKEMIENKIHEIVNER